MAIDMLWVSDIPLLNLTDYHLSTFVPSSANSSTTSDTARKDCHDGNDDNNYATGIVIAIAIPTILFVIVVNMLCTRGQRCIGCFSYSGLDPVEKNIFLMKRMSSPEPQL